MVLRDPDGQFLIIRFEMMGAQDKKSGKPNKAWHDLVSIGAATKEKYLYWSRTRKWRVTKMLRTFFEIDSDPFESFGSKDYMAAYRANFTVEPES